MEQKWTLVCLMLTLATIQSTKAEDFSLEYFKDVTMDCDITKYNMTSQTTIKKISWLLPNGDIITESDPDGHIIVDNENDTLSVKRISDDDFGYYYCLIVREDFNVDRIRHGLNVDGASYGNLLEEYKNNAIRGGIAAAILFAVLATFCLFWNLRYHKRNQRNKAVDKLDDAIGQFDLKAYDNVAMDGKNDVEEVKINSATEDNKL